MDKRIGSEEIQGFLQTLRKYKSGKANLENRIISSEQWWKLRNASMETEHGTPGSYRAQSGWLHNVITSKHAEGMDSYPEPLLLAREPEDQEEAKILSQILPCILEQNEFEGTYSDLLWQKLKFGTSCCKVFWDPNKLHGLGDVAIEKVNLLNVFWEPGVTNVQDSRYFFHTELWDTDILTDIYPELKGKLGTTSFTAQKFLYDDTVSTEDKVTVVEVWYHKGDKLHYCRFVGDTVLYASENEAGMENGYYEHGKYPFVFDPLFPIEGSPCGYGYIDLCRNQQTEIDLLKTAIVHNAMVGTVPRYFLRTDGNVNEEEYLDLNRPLVHVNGNLGEDSIRAVPHEHLDGNYLALLNQTVSEMRETTGNTETGSGIISVQMAASAIHALQEASGKLTRDSTNASFRAYRSIVELSVELIRQFYTVPRQFRVIGRMGASEYVQYSNKGLMPVDQGEAFGVELGWRMPTFDIRIEAQRKNAYTTLAQNELALKLYEAGFFDPMRREQALGALELMQFEGRDGMMRMLEDGKVADERSV